MMIQQDLTLFDSVSRNTHSNQQTQRPTEAEQDANQPATRLMQGQVGLDGRSAHSNSRLNAITTPVLERGQEHPKISPEHAFSTGAEKEEIIKALLRERTKVSFPNQNWLSILFFPIQKSSTTLSKQEEQCVHMILSTIKSQRKTQSPKLIEGMLDTIKFALNRHFQVAFCTNASANKVAQEWSQVLNANWNLLVGLQSPDKKKLFHCYFPRPAQPNTFNNQARIDIIGKCGKGDLTPDYPSTPHRGHLNPQTLESIGITKNHTIHFAGNELKDAVMAKVLKDQGYKVNFYFMNQLSVHQAIDYLSSHANSEEQQALVTHCQKWTVDEWPTTHNIQNGLELLDLIQQQTNQQSSDAKVALLLDFHGTVTDQLTDFKEITKKVSEEFLD